MINKLLMYVGGARTQLCSSATLIFALAYIHPGCAAEPVTIKLWEHGAPGTPATKPEDDPVLYMSAPVGDTALNGSAVIVLPGGGYGALAMDHEGRQIADWLNSQGITAF